MKYIKSAFILSTVCLVHACSDNGASMNQGTAEAQGESIQRNILTANRDSLGSVVLRDLGVAGTEVTVNLSGLDSAGVHAMHFHENGSCNAPDFTSAGGHYNPTDRQHGMLEPGGPHAGDMMNIEVNSNGVGKMTIVNEQVSIYGEHGLPAIFDENGSALIIHAQADDYTSQPSGAAGPRIGCAVLEAR